MSNKQKKEEYDASQYRANIFVNNILETNLQSMLGPDIAIQFNK